MNSEPSPFANLVDAFCMRHQMPGHFVYTANSHYLPLVQRVIESKPVGPVLLAISGSQGSGKSTLAEFVAEVTAAAANWNVAALSIDDFYLTHAERQRLSREVHPLLQTRGVPGTHDVAMIKNAIAGLENLRSGQGMTLPRFDKLADDRCPEEEWSRVQGPVDLIVFEGWCLGAQPQSAKELETPINELEAQKDEDGHWRCWVNQRLAEEYLPLWDKFDAMAFFQVPGFASVVDWRYEQECKLAEQGGSTGKAMTREQVVRFIQYYQRITEHNLALLPERADILFHVDEQHQVTETRYQSILFSG